MVGAKDQLFINISPELGKSRVTFSQFSWVGLILAAICVGIIRGAPVWVGAILLVGLNLPVVVWAIARRRKVQISRLFDDLYMIAWAIVALLAMSLGGGALSPLTVILVVGPLAALSLGRVAIFSQTALFGLLAYALTIFAGAFGWSEFIPQAWWEFAAPLAVAALVQVVILIWTLKSSFASDDLIKGAKTTSAGSEQAIGNGASILGKAAEAQGAAALGFDLPILLLEIASEGRIRRLEGAQALRWPELVVGRTMSAALGEVTGEDYTSPDGGIFRVLRQPGETGAEWIALIPMDKADTGAGDMSVPLEEALAKAAAVEKTLSERTAFFAGLGHDLKTPLNAILGFADLMKAEVRGPLPDVYKEYPAIIHESGQDLMLLVDDILDLAKAEASGHRLDLEPVDLVASAASVVRQLQDQAERAQVKLLLKNKEEVWAEADARAVRQIWQNLVSNAIKYSESGGTVTLSAGKAAGSVALSVRDKGAGMDQNDLDRIATPFAQGDNSKGRSGTGLGLAVVHTFAKLHGGKVVIDTEKGKGTQVRVTLPALDVSRLNGLEDAAQ